MSRTLKDRPYWVRANDPDSSGRSVIHRHDLFGEAIYRAVRIKDKDGNQVYEEKVIPGFGTKFLGYAPDTVVSLPVIQDVLVGHVSEFCTADRISTDSGKPVQYAGSRSINPCYPELDSYPVLYNRPTKLKRKTFHSSNRKREHVSLRESFKAFRGTSDYDEVDFDFESPRRNFHRKHWD